MTLATLTPVPIPNKDFQAMLRFAKLVYGLQHQPAYQDKLASILPDAASVQPENPSMLMGYDFHFTENGPKLIEINNNAGGLFDVDSGWIPQSQNEMQGSLASRLQAMFPDSWQHIAIVDEDVRNQYMYPEMQAYAELLRSEGRRVSILSPQDLYEENGFLCFDGQKIDGIYNRHTDFYLESQDMSLVRQAFERGAVQLNPYPRSYALVGDKNRMVDWWRNDFLDMLNENDAAMIRNIVPETRLLAECDMVEAWKNRKSWVFKPAARHGGKGVLLGKAMSRVRFEKLEAESTVMQKMIPASTIEIEDVTFKFDIRLYMHGTKLIGLAGRAWQGQITNFRGEGSGWTSIKVDN